MSPDHDDRRAPEFRCTAVVVAMGQESLSDPLPEPEPLFSPEPDFLPESLPPEPWSSFDPAASFLSSPDLPEALCSSPDLPASFLSSPDLLEALCSSPDLPASF